MSRNAPNGSTTSTLSSGRTMPAISAATAHCGRPDSVSPSDVWWGPPILPTATLGTSNEMAFADYVGNVLLRCACGVTFCVGHVVSVDSMTVTERSPVTVYRPILLSVRMSVRLSFSLSVFLCLSVCLSCFVYFMVEMKSQIPIIFSNFNLSQLKTRQLFYY